MEELSTTENPLWLETKLRPYEEQELTMNVFGDQNEQNAELPTLVSKYDINACSVFLSNIFKLL